MPLLVLIFQEHFIHLVKPLGKQILLVMVRLFSKRLLFFLHKKILLFHLIILEIFIFMPRKLKMIKYQHTYTLTKITKYVINWIVIILQLIILEFKV